ncbi:HET-domain-containing protein [Trametes versicolor FP-101664 SS1]|uniref:HET-domain-containing protein n=1 Tax=Trametes versicolor (strain FP-101664) TaxID=717944 RepID=R7S7H4_TRAVS|nr:HET-domain-containing protein [Trametes versicolor FP-101664 SS1]EIW51946.1 HET-domain-containing protein [Trametes versicolor FP-101664 SS1]
MPRFLNTWTGEFEVHSDPKKVTYAILSHVWRSAEDGGEQTYGDVRKIQVAVKKGLSHISSSPPTKYREEGTIFAHPKLSDKIKGFCRVAREAGFLLVWNDACCINKTDSVELSEAINSMYEWYRLSDMCYVYLADVRDGDRPQAGSSAFPKSRWHTRGWTLQELIAPERLVFLTGTWRFLGTKMGLARTLQKVTGIDFEILTGRATLESVSVARRLSWAAKRETTRVEDHAYSLMGIFGVHMSPIYGEGENAFLRLQEEVMKTVPDQSIFSGGGSCTMHSLTKRSSSHEQLGPHYPGLFASSPLAFTSASSITPVTPSRLATTLGLRGSEDVPPMDYVFTPEGVRMRLLCLPLSGSQLILDTFRELRTGDACVRCRRLGDPTWIALLQCEDEYGHPIALPLYRPRNQGGNDQGLSVGTHSPCADVAGQEPYRTVHLSQEALSIILNRLQPKVVEVLLLRHFSRPSILKSLQPDDDLPRLDLWRADHYQQVAFDIAPHSVDALRAQGFSPSSLQVTYSKTEITLRTTLEHSSGRYSSRAPKAVQVQLSLTDMSDDTKFEIRSAKYTEARFFVNAESEQGTWKVYINDANRHGGHAASTTRTGHCMLDISRRTIALAEYIVHSDGEWGEDSRPRIARDIRVALEFPFAKPADGRTSNLWLSINISEYHLEYIPLIETAPTQGSSSEQTGNVSAFASAASSPSSSSTVTPTTPTRQLPPLTLPEHDQSHMSPKDADVHPATKHDFNILQRENATLRAQLALLTTKNTNLASQVAALSSQNSVLVSQMATVFARLDALNASPATNIIEREARDPV